MEFEENTIAVEPKREETAVESKVEVDTVAAIVDTVVERREPADITLCPWKPVYLNHPIYDQLFFVKFSAGSHSYEFQITDSKSVWHEAVNDEDILKRSKVFNPGMDLLLGDLIALIENCLTHGDSGVDFHVDFIKSLFDINHPQLVMTITLKLEEKLQVKEGEETEKKEEKVFLWKLNCSPTGRDTIKSTLVLPMFSVVNEFQRRQEELIKLLQLKDQELEAYKALKPSRRGAPPSIPSTEPFVAESFKMATVESKGFVDIVRQFDKPRFDDEAASLYTAIMKKRQELEEEDTKAETEAEAEKQISDNNSHDAIVADNIESENGTGKRSSEDQDEGNDETLKKQKVA